MSARPAVTVHHARLPAGCGGRARLEAVLAAATPAATGVPAAAHLVVRRLRLPAGAPLPAQAAQLVALLRAARASARRNGAGPGFGVGEADLYLEDETAADAALVAAALAGRAADPLLMAVLADGSQPMLRWRRHIFAQPHRAALCIAALATAGLGAWLDRFTPAELVAARAALLAWHGAAAPALPRPGRARLRAASALPPAVRHAVTTANAQCAGPAAMALLATALVAAARPDLLAAPAAVATLAPGAAPAPAAASSVAPNTTAQGAGSPRAAVTPLPATGTEAPKPSQRGAAPATPAVAPAGHAPQPAAAPDHAGPVAPAPPTPAATPAIATAFTSDHAGLMFLLNAVIAMGLYGDFSRPQQRLAGLSPLALIDWLGLHWRGRRFRRDPLHGWLRGAAGLQPGEAASRRLRPPPTLPDGRALRAGTGAAWLRGLASLLHDRLASATGAADPLALLLAQPGRIMATGRDVTMAFPLAGHPLPLRIAGLDRDPGWLPAAGLAVRFAFPC